MIDKWLNKIDRLDTASLTLWIVTCSILLAAWMQYIQHGWINSDSVLYFEQARLFRLGDIKGMFEVYPWPFYSACIGIIHSVTPLSAQASAQLLNMLFFGMATASFLKLIKLAGGNNRTIFMGALLLFSSLYIVGDVLEMLMRDEGFWAFYLTALVFFIRYTKSHQLSDALLWQFCIIIATLFRLEAILFLLFLPFACLLNQPLPIIRKLKILLNTYTLSILIGILIAITVITQSHINLSQFGRLNEIFTANLHYEFTNKLLTQAQIMSEQVLGEYLDEFAIPGLLLTFAYVIGSKIITATGWVGIGLAIFNFKSPTNEMQPAAKVILNIVCCIALTLAALIIIKVFVLSSRYVVSLAWVLLIFASFSLSELSNSSNKKLRCTFIAILLILSLSFIKNILPKQDGYNYMQDSISWLNNHKIHSNNVFFDDTRMRYYAGLRHSGNWANNWEITLNAIDNQTINQHQYLALTQSKKHPDHVSSIQKKLTNYKEVKRFNNRKAIKSIVIYRRVSGH